MLERWTCKTVAVIGLGLMGQKHRSLSDGRRAPRHRCHGQPGGQRRHTERIRDLLEEMARKACSDEPTDVDATLQASTAESARHCQRQYGLRIRHRGPEAEARAAAQLPSSSSRRDLHSRHKHIGSAGLRGAGGPPLHPERILGLHWDEPAHIHTLYGDHSGQSHRSRISGSGRRTGAGVGQRAVQLRKEIRGFITNRISYAMFREACYLVDSGICTVEDVDRSAAQRCRLVDSLRRALPLHGPDGRGRLLPRHA